MKNKTQVILLPVNQKAKENDIILLKEKRNISSVEEGQLALCVFPNASDSGNVWETQKIYFLADEQPQKGDWFIEFDIKGTRDTYCKKPYLCDIGNTGGFILTKNNGNFPFPENCKKIIATNDESLENETFFEIEGNQKVVLPRPPQEFINYYVEQYKNGNIIEWFDVEYKDKCLHSSVVNGCEHCEKQILKINPDNTLYMHKSAFHFKNNPTIFESPKEFMDLINKNTEKNTEKSTMKTEDRFPLMLSAENAQKIINIACQGPGNWKGKLAAKWGQYIVLGDNIEITEDFYIEMRNACTEPQHKLFDEIFGTLIIDEKNPFVKKFRNLALNKTSIELFDDEFALEIGTFAAEDMGRPDLSGKSLFISKEYDVILHKKTNVQGTIIEIIKK